MHYWVDCDTVSCHDQAPWDQCEYICNGDFEWYSICITDQDQLCRAEPWQISHTASGPSSSPDYFNRCFSGTCPDPPTGTNMCMDVPTNSLTQYQPSCANEDGYAGFIAVQKTPQNDQQREYIQQPLRQALTQGQTYHIEMRLSHNGSSDLACDKIQLYFSNGQPVQTPWGLFPTINSNQLTSPSGLITNHNWTLYSADFTAPANLDWVTIGVFAPLSQINITTGNHSSYYDTHGYMQKYNAYYFIDSISVTYLPTITATASPATICNDGCTNLSASGASTYTWMPGNLTGNNINVCPNTNTTYTVTGTSSAGCTGSATVTVTVVPPPDAPIIVGNNNTCDTAATYTISNTQAGYTYSWSIVDTNYSNSFPQTGSSISVVWHPLWTTSSVHTWLIVVVTDSNGCSAADSIKIWKCCKKNDGNIVYNDETITDASVFIGNPDPPYFNGIITVDADISASNISYIFMGPEAKFIVNPPYTFAITTSNISAGCRYMWDGIYVTDSNAKVVVEQQSSVADALNAIYSENGGKFELKNSNFYNNYTGVLVKNNFYGAGGPWYSHKGLIYGCAFSKSGSGMIAPYLYGKPMHGIFSDNVYNLTIGDSTQGTTGRNTFSNIFCGIASFYSSINVYNNHFYFINTNSCTLTPGDYYNLQCETAIHCAAVDQDVYHNSSQLICGAGNNSLNTFDTCRYAIYTYNTLTKVDRAKITRTGVGVYCREAKTYSYVKNSSVKNKISAGIEFVNTLALTRGYTIYNDTVLDPLMGIYLLNVTSNPNFSTLQTTVSNNYITNARNVPMYGMDFEVCDYIDAYCNMVRRNNLPPSSHRLIIRGTQINHSVSAQLHDNTYDTLGVSVKGRGSLLGTQFKCNTSDGSYYGFYFDDVVNSIQTALSDQGTLSSPNDNMWYNDPDPTTYFRIDGTYNNPNTISWYYRNPYPNQYGPTEPASYSSEIYLLPAVNPIAANCQSCTYGSMLAGNSNPVEENQIDSLSSSGINNTELTAIMNESNNYQQLDESFKYFEKQYAYKKLEANQQNLSTTLNSYYYSLRNSNIGMFEQIYRAVEDNNLGYANTLNNVISPVNTIEKNRKWVNSVYFDYIIPQKAIPQNIIDNLETLASSSPFVQGDAVYSARAIVGYTEPETVVSPKNLKQDNKNNDIINKYDITVNVYPNPAENYFNVELKGLNGDFCTFIIRNLLGTKLIAKEVRADGTTITINTSKLNNGLHVYEVLNADGINIKSGKLVISK